MVKPANSIAANSKPDPGRMAREHCADTEPAPPGAAPWLAGAAIGLRRKCRRLRTAHRLDAAVSAAGRMPEGYGSNRIGRVAGIRSSSDVDAPAHREAGPNWRSGYGSHRLSRRTSYARSLFLKTANPGNGRNASSASSRRQNLMVYDPHVLRAGGWNYGNARNWCWEEELRRYPHT